MVSIIEYRDDQPPANDYPRRIVSPTAPSACCMNRMERIGHAAFDADWRFFYKRCRTCGYTVRYFYAPSLTAIFEAAKQLRLRLAEMNLGTAKRKRRTQAEIDEVIAAAMGPSRLLDQQRHSLTSLRHRKPAPSPA